MNQIVAWRCTLNNTNFFSTTDKANKPNIRLDKAQKDKLNLKRDKMFKLLFSRAEILAPLLYELVPELREYSPEAIKHAMNITPADHLSIPGKKDVYFDVSFDINTLEGLNVYLTIDLEMQTSKKSYNVVKRAVYYTARAAARHLPEGEDYDRIGRIYSIWLCDFNEHYNRALTHQKFNMMETGTNGCTYNLDADILRTTVIYIPEYIRYAALPAQDIIKALDEGNIPDLTNAICRRYINNTIQEEVKTIMRDREIVINEELLKETEINYYRETGKKEGREEGREAGREEGRSEAICSALQILLDLNLNKEQIYTQMSLKYTLTREQVDELISKIQN